MRPSASRAAARIAWRQARRSPWRSALVVAMVALPIGGLATSLVSIRTAMPTPEERTSSFMGTSDVAILELPEDLRPQELLAKLPPGSRLIERRAVYVSAVVRGSLLYLQLEQFPSPVDRPPLRGMYKVLDGRAPERKGEAALHPESLAAFSVRVGDEVSIEELGLTLRVTGTIVGTERLKEEITLVGPGTLRGVADAGPSAYFIELPPSVPRETATRVLAGEDLGYSIGGGEVIYGEPDETDPAQQDRQARFLATTASFAGTVLALFATGLVAAAAFVVGARRQLRMIGLIGSAGGEPAHVRATVLLGGAALGFLGSALGVTLGIVATHVGRPLLERIGGRLVGPVEIPLAALAGALALGTLASTFAAYGPARSAARVSIVEALAGRFPLPQPPGRLARLGGLAVLLGGAVTAGGTIAEEEAILTAGLLVMLGGFLLAIPLMVSWIGRLAPRLPMSPRLAARDIARHGRRTGAALAAATIALSLPVGIAALTLSDEARERRIPFMGAEHLLVTMFGPNDDGAAEALRADLQELLPRALIVPLRPAALSADPGSVQPGMQEAIVRVEGAPRTTSEGVAFIESGPLLVGGPDLLRAFNADEGIPALEDGKVVAVGPDSTDQGFVHLHLSPDQAGNPRVKDIPAVEAGSTRYASLGLGGENIYVIALDAARELGLRPSGPSQEFTSFVLRSGDPLADEEIQAAKEIAAGHPGAYVQSAKDFGSDATFVRTILTLAGGLMALAIVGVAIALVGAESRRDQAIMVAVGADPWVRRRVTGAKALLLAGLAGVLALPTGFIPVAVFQAAQQTGLALVVPWWVMGVAVAGVPLLAGITAALASRQPEAARMLRPIA